MSGYVPVHDYAPSAPPVYAPNETKFPDRSIYRDLLFAILFIVNLLAVVALLIVGIVKDGQQQAVYFSQLDIPAHELQIIAAVVVGSITVAAVYSTVYLFIIRRFTRQVIIITLIASVVLWLGFSVFLFIQRQIWPAVITLIGAVISGVCYFFWRARIPFAVQMLQTVTARIDEYPAMTNVAYTSLALQFLWIALWAGTVTMTRSLVGNNDTLAYIYGVFLILAFYWVSQVVKNVTHVTTSGTFASWYFYGSQGMPSNPTLKAFKRTMTTSFGSVCLGSLLVAALKTLRTLVNSARNQSNEFIVCITDCILGIIDGLIQYFNIYAFAQVAIYGKSYCQAAKSTWQLLKSHGIEAIINDNIISGVLSMGAFIGAVITAIFGATLSYIFVPEYWILCASIGLVVGFVMSIVSMEVIESGVATIFVCFAMDPIALQRNDVILYNKFYETYNQYLSPV
eukprot:TRINITY_DN9656_c0_g1_i1.p1 TRINITY_DN9656_c0_g1~~TRINITY_DN9656_c0_g1_i1.p1  ORF type:complete len:454 (-),score=76.03 TRINITY_DN9656_c0_g1_i1:48-1409(-)